MFPAGHDVLTTPTGSPPPTIETEYKLHAKHVSIELHARQSNVMGLPTFVGEGYVVEYPSTISTNIITAAPQVHHLSYTTG